MQNQVRKNKLPLQLEGHPALHTWSGPTSYPLALNGHFFLKRCACCKSPCATNPRPPCPSSAPVPAGPVFRVPQIPKQEHCYLLLHAFCTSAPLLQTADPLTWWPWATHTPPKGFPSLLQHTLGPLTLHLWDSALPLPHSCKQHSFGKIKFSSRTLSCVKVHSRHFHLHFELQVVLSMVRSGQKNI